MRLMYRPFGEPLEVDAQVPHILVIEHQRTWRNFIQMLHEQCTGEEGGIILSDDKGEIKLSRCAELIINPFQLEINQKKILTSLNNELKERAVESSNYVATMDLLSKIMYYLDQLSAQLSYPVTMEEIEIGDVLKIAGVKVETEKRSLCENIINYIGLLSDVINISFCALVNIGQYLSPKELSELYKMARYKSVALLLIENRDYLPRDLLQRLTIFDNDQCVVRNY